MPTYRFYTSGPDGYLFGIPKVAECVDDKEAVEKAIQLASDRDVEIWDHKRLVARLPGYPLRSDALGYFSFQPNPLQPRREPW
jgi:hypothetical protein